MWLHDELHLYPSAAALALVGSACFACQVVLRLLWLAKAQRKIRVDIVDADSKGDISKVRASWPWALDEDASMPLWCWLSVRAGLHRPRLWKRFARRSLFVIVLVMTAVIGFNSTMLFMRTGSWIEQPYDWYSLQGTGLRIFGETVTLPKDILESCVATDSARTNSSLLTVDAAIASQAQGTSSKPTIVYVVPYGPNGVIEVTETQAHMELLSKPVSPASTAARKQAKRPVFQQPAQQQYSRVIPVDDLTMFPYLWQSILGSGFSDKVQVTSSWQRSVPDSALTYQLVKTQDELNELESGSNILAVVQWMPFALQLADSLPTETKLAFIALSKEDCNNPFASQFMSHPKIKFGLFPYGDCSIVDRERFSVLPLGPSFEHGFPVNTHETHIPALTDRKHLLNLMVSWTVEKPTRIQAMIGALNVCESYSGDGLDCVIEHNDLAFKVLQKVDTTLGLNLRWLLSSAPNAYVENLKQSIFTLCPFGKNPEQYRIWEALAAGSIPIIEDMPQDDSSYEPGQFYHPSYPTTWKCRPDVDVHGFLKQKNAPVIFVTDWKRDLPRIIQHYTRDHPEELIKLQARAKTWYRQAGEHVQADLITKSLQHFGQSL